jgi:hypothetical protein
MRHAAGRVTYQGMTKVLLPLVLLATILGGAALVHPTGHAAAESARISDNNDPTEPTMPVPVEPTKPTQPSGSEEEDEAA